MEFSNELVIAIVSAVLGPLAVTLVGSIAARMGSGARIRRVEFFQKEVGLLDQAIAAASTHGMLDDAERLKGILNGKFDNVIAFMAGEESEAKTLDRYERYRQKSFLTRLIVLPWPRTILGWIGTIVYYLYGFIFVFLAVLAAIPGALEAPVDPGETPEEAYWTMMLGLVIMLVTSFLIAWGARALALFFARRTS